MKKITTEKYWSKRWNRTSLPLKVKLNKNPAFLISEYLKKYYTGSSMIEIGCAIGIWMHFFAKQLGTSVSGIEYSKVGYKKTLENFRLLKIEGELFYADFLNYNFKLKYDTVLSLGFIEHFSSPHEIIKKHAEILNKKGRIIISVPNFSKESIYYHIQNLLYPKDLKKHNLRVCNKSGLIKECKKAGLSVVDCSYVGGVNFGLNYFGNRFKLLQSIYYTINAICVRFLKLIKYTHENSLLSPYIFIVLEK